MPPRVAIVGAGLAGAACARRLADAGIAVQLFDKSRGVGGRLATRRAEWTGAEGQPQASVFDHGSPGFTAQSAEFGRQVARWQGEGLLARWQPVMAPGSYVPLEPPALWVPIPDMPALCRRLLAGLAVTTRCTIEALRRDAGGWSLQASSGAVVGQGFDAVVITPPPAQSAVLLAPHRADWAQQARSAAMVPGWTLMGVTEDVDEAAPWHLAWPPSGPLAWVIRNDTKPGRQRMPGRAHWVLHAGSAWSATHLEAPADAVREALQRALADWLGRTPAWRHAAVHRWRYASVPRSAASAGRCWWDPSAGLGVCGDALGGAGVEGAWASGDALAAAVLERFDRHPAPSAASTTRRARGPSAV